MFLLVREDIKEGMFYLKNSEAHHLRDVLRHKRGDLLDFFDGEGGIYRGEIIEVRKEKIKVRILSQEYKEKKPPFFHLVQAVPKKEKMDLIVEKATELGVEEIIPLITARTVVKPAKERKEALWERWRKISLSATKQARRAFLPRISKIKEFSQVIEEIPPSASLIIPSLAERGLDLRELDWSKFKEDVFIFIGPEGDFTPEEFFQAKEKGAIPVSLGEAVLRSETAAIYILSILNYELK